MSTRSLRASRARVQGSHRPPSAIAIQGAVQQLFDATDVAPALMPDEPIGAADVIGVAGVSALNGAAVGEAFAALFDDADEEAREAARVVGALAGFACGLHLLDDGWRLRAGRSIR